MRSFGRGNGNSHRLKILSINVGSRRGRAGGVGSGGKQAGRDQYHDNSPGARAKDNRPPAGIHWPGFRPISSRATVIFSAAAIAIVSRFFPRNRAHRERIAQRAAAAGHRLGGAQRAGDTIDRYGRCRLAGIPPQLDRCFGLPAGRRSWPQWHIELQAPLPLAGSGGVIGFARRHDIAIGHRVAARHARQFIQRTNRPQHALIFAGSTSRGAHPGNN